MSATNDLHKAINYSRAHGYNVIEVHVSDSFYNSLRDEIEALSSYIPGIATLKNDILFAGVTIKIKDLEKAQFYLVCAPLAVYYSQQASAAPIVKFCPYCGEKLPVGKQG